MNFFRRAKKRDQNTAVGSSQTDAAASPASYSIVGYGSGQATSPTADAIPMAEGTVYPAHEVASNQNANAEGSTVTSIPVTDGDLVEELPAEEDVDSLLAEEDLADEDYLEETDEIDLGEGEEVDLGDLGDSNEESATAEPAEAPAAPPAALAEAPPASAPATADELAIEDEVVPGEELVTDEIEEDLGDEEEVTLEELDDVETAMDEVPATEADFPTNSSYPTDLATTASAPAPVLGWPPEGADLPPSPESAVMAIDTEFDTNPAKTKLKKKKKKKL